MKFISHRGNINGSDPKTENKPDQVLKCIEKGLDVEIDIWFLNNKVYLGHDEPDHQISMTFLQKNKRNLWCHAKNFDTLTLMKQNGIHHFWHQEDFYTITSQGFIWTYPNIKSYSINSVLVVTRPEDLKKEMSGCFGICTDYIVDAQKFFTNK